MARTIKDLLDEYDGYKFHSYKNMWAASCREEIVAALRRAQRIEEAAEKVLRRFGDEYEGRLADLVAALDDKETT